MKSARAAVAANASKEPAIIARRLVRAEPRCAVCALTGSWGDAISPVRTIVARNNIIVFNTGCFLHLSLDWEMGMLRRDESDVDHTMVVSLRSCADHTVMSVRLRVCLERAGFRIFETESQQAEEGKTHRATVTQQAI